MKQTILPLLDSLIRIPSVSTDIEKLNEIVDFVEAEFWDYQNAIIKRYEFNTKPSIVIQNFEWLEADIILNGHLDVVPPSEDGQFEPVHKDGKIFARGAGDMKAWDAIMITLMKEIFEADFTEKKISLILTTDEEVSWDDWAWEIVKLWYKAREGVLVPDSGWVKKIVTAEKGIIDVYVVLQGKSAHSSRPWTGENAIEKNFELYKALKDLIEEPEKLNPENDYWGSTVELTMLEWGTATNVIPENCKAHFNIRVTETFSDMWVLKIKIMKKLEEYWAKLLEYQEGSIVFTDSGHPFIQRYLKTCEEVLWFVPEIKKEHGASDGRYFAEKWMPLLLHLPDCQNIHSREENVSEEAIFQIYDCYKAFIMAKS